MFRAQVLAGILSLCGFLAWTTGASAEEPKPAPPAGVPGIVGADEKPANSSVEAMPIFQKGTRILFQGDSITDAGRNRNSGQLTGGGYPYAGVTKMPPTKVAFAITCCFY